MRLQFLRLVSNKMPAKGHGTQPRQSQKDGLQRASSIPNRRRSTPQLPLQPKARSKDVESQADVENEPTEESWSVISGPVALLSVAFLWGTYGPALKVLYSLPYPPDPAALTAARGVIQAGSLWVTSLWMTDQGVTSNPKSKEQRPSRLALRAGVEMGFWNFLATSLQAVGLERTTAVRGGFIIQATAILTPLLATITGEVPGRNVWVGCGIALASTLLITMDSVDPLRGMNSTSLISLGDAAVFGAAFFYSVTTVRLGYYAQQLPAISLASAKSNALAAWAVLWFAYLMLQKPHVSEAVLEAWQGASQPALWLLIFWSALGPGALAAFLQSKGQSSVPSSQAQVYYSSTPIWSALLAILLIDGEKMGLLGWIGGAGIIAAGLIASR